MKANTIQKIDSGSRRTYVYTYLYKNIIDLSLPPGTALSEKEIAVQLNVSRTPAREAMIQLAQEDLVEIVPQIGTFVSLIDPALVEESRFMRETLEIAVIKLAIEKMSDIYLFELEKNIKLQYKAIKAQDYKEFFAYDDAFHEIIFISLGRKRTWQALDQMNAQFKRARILRLATTEISNWEEILNEHEALYGALKDKNASLAEKLMKEHLTKGVFHLDELKSKYPAYFKVPNS